MVPDRDLLLGRSWECSSVSPWEWSLQQFVCFLHRGTLDHFLHSKPDTFTSLLLFPLSFHYLIHRSFLSLSPSKSGWPQMISAVGIQCKCSWAVWLWRACMGYCAIPCCFVIALRCLEEPCSRRGPPVLEKGPIHHQHLLTDQWNTGSISKLKVGQTRFKPVFILLKWTETKELYTLTTEYC